jgi:large subunit ribosomal protein L31e
MADEKILTLNLRKKMLKVAEWKRGKYYSRLFRKMLEKNLKTDKIKIGTKVNEKIWKRGTENPPLKIRIKSVKQDDGTVKIELME